MFGKKPANSRFFRYNSSVKNKLFYYLGNALIVSSVLSTLFVYIPIFIPVTQTRPSEDVVMHGDTIEIPKINAYTEVVLDVDPWNEAEYLKALNRGVAHAKGTAYPWSGGGVSFLFAHSTLPPWEMTRTNTPFLSLNKLTQHDLIVIRHSGVAYRYEVTDKQEVWPQEVERVFNNTEDVLILQTCTPLGTSLKRLLVFAKKM